MTLFILSGLFCAAGFTNLIKDKTEKDNFYVAFALVPIASLELLVEIFLYNQINLP